MSISIEKVVGEKISKSSEVRRPNKYKVFRLQRISCGHIRIFQRDRRSNRDVRSLDRFILRRLNNVFIVALYSFGNERKVTEPKQSLIKPFYD